MHFLKAVISRTWKPFLAWYLAKPRPYRYRDLDIVVRPGVFHPGLFFSTKLLIRYLEGESLKGKTLLELGSGSGLLALSAAKAGANVTACDISRTAVSNTLENAVGNGLQIRVLHSDLFSNVPARAFDYITINPPYYPEARHKESDHAWFCGEGFEYFHGLFAGLHGYMHSRTKAVMVLSEDCRIAEIQRIAEGYGLQMRELERKHVGWEWNYLFAVERISV